MCASFESIDLIVPQSSFLFPLVSHGGCFLVNIKQAKAVRKFNLLEKAELVTLVGAVKCLYKTLMAAMRLVALTLMDTWCTYLCPAASPALWKEWNPRNAGRHLERENIVNGGHKKCFLCGYQIKIFVKPSKINFAANRTT